MAANKKKKEVKVRDLKPSKDAKGGAARHANSTQTAGHSTAGRSKTDGHIIIER